MRNLTLVSLVAIGAIAGSIISTNLIQPVNAQMGPSSQGWWRCIMAPSESSVSKVGLFMRTMERFVPVIWIRLVSSVISKDPDVLHGNKVLTSL
jgi:hypothetical protein